MKKIFLVLAVLTIGMSSCDKDDTEPGLKANTWKFKPDGYEWGGYRAKTNTLNVQGFQVFEAISEDNPGGNGNGIASTVRFMFKNVNPPPTGTYKVVAYGSLEHEDEVAVYYQVYGDPRVGGSQTSFLSHDGSGKTISYTFANGKASLKCTEIPVYQTGFGPQRGELSVNISQ